MKDGVIPNFMNVNLISIESSANRSSAALLRAQGARVVVAQSVSDAGQGHAEQLLPMIDGLLAQTGLSRHDLSGVVFGQGPGGFTGLRIACGMAQGLGLGLDIPVFPVSSLLAVAEHVRPVAQGALVVSIIDARMKEAFVAAYRETGATELECLQPPCLVAADQLPTLIGQLKDRAASGRTDAVPVVLAGSGVREFAGPLALPGVSSASDIEPDAGTMALVGLRAWHDGRFILADQAAPLYVRDKVAFTASERAQGQGGNPKAVPLAVEGQAGEAVSASHDTDRLWPSLAPFLARYTVARMSSEDIDSVVDIERKVQSHPWTAGNFRDSLAAGYPAWVVRADGEIIAFSLQLFAPDVSHLLLIGVLPKWQGKGVGAGLLAWGESCLRDSGLDMQMLEVRPSNERAIAFYRKHGYAQIGVRKGYYPAGRGQSEDAWIFQKAVVS